MSKCLFGVCPAVMMLFGSPLAGKAAPVQTISMFNIWASVDGHTSSFTIPGKVVNNRKVFFDYMKNEYNEYYGERYEKEFYSCSIENATIKGFMWIYNLGTPWVYTKLGSLEIYDFIEYYDSEESYQMWDYRFVATRKDKGLLFADVNWNWDYYDKGSIKRTLEITGDRWQWINGSYNFVPSNFKVSAVNAPVDVRGLVPSVPLPPSILMFMSSLGVTSVLGLSRLRPR